MTRPNGRFTADAMTDALHVIATDLGVDARDAELLRLTNNAVFALPRAGLVIRITRSHSLHDRVHKVARLAAWFATIDAPTIRPATSAEQPVRTGDLLATVWHHLPPRPPEPTTADMGHVLRKFHRLGAPPFLLPVWDPVTDARRRISDAEHLDDTDRRSLLDWCGRLEPEVERLNTQSPLTLVHGDAHAGNLLRDAAGRVVLCDLDATCLGPWQVDLVAVAVGEARFGRAGAHAALADAYGYDVTTDPDWPLLREARELKMVAAAVPLLASGPGVAQEFTRRLRSIQHHDHNARWTPFADLQRQPG